VQPPWWLVGTLGPSVTLFAVGIGLLAGRPLTFVDPWIIVGWMFVSVGGGYAILLGLFYLRWRDEEAYIDQHGRRWRRKDIDRLPAAEFRKLCEANPDLADWWEERQPGLHRPILTKRK